MRPTEIGSVYCLESAENWGFLHIPQKSNLQIEWWAENVQNRPPSHYAEFSVRH